MHPDDYTVAWICALPLDLTAACAMLDEHHGAIPSPEYDTNNYTLGRIEQHNIVISYLPSHQYGTINASAVITNLSRTFRRVRVALMVGIGGGAPIMGDIHLGDVVVGIRVMQYDMGKALDSGKFHGTAQARMLHPSISTTLSTLRPKEGYGSRYMLRT